MFIPKSSYCALAVLSVFAFLSLPCAAQTTVVFKLKSTVGGPFPNNSLTVPDLLQKSGLRINLPPEENTCAFSSSSAVCGNRELLNKLDGFSENPRLMVCFSGPINPDTLQPGIFILPVSARGYVRHPSTRNAVA